MKLILTILFLLQISLFAQSVTITKITVDGMEFDEETQYINLEDYENNNEIQIFFEISNIVHKGVDLCFDSSSGSVINSIDSGNTTNYISFDISGNDKFLSTDGTEGTRPVYIIVNYADANGADIDTSDSVTIKYDTKKPIAPTEFEAVSGDTNLRISWKHPTEDTKDRGDYKVYYKIKDSTDEEKTQTTDGSDTEMLITGLTNETTYTIRMATIDKAGNESDISSLTVEGTPMPVDDFFEYYKKHQGGEDGGYCFIATAAYGSYDNGMVQILRNFRDDYLAQTETGKKFIKTYYEISPKYAKMIRNNEFLSFTARILLEPVVFYVNFLMYSSIFVKYAVLILLSVLYSLYLSSKKQKKQLINI